MSKKNNKTKFYAIKEGKGVSNLIVNTWDECSKLVLGYNSVYKSFNTREEAEKYLDIANNKLKEKIIKTKEVKKHKRGNIEVIRVDLVKDLYEKFTSKCADVGMSKEKVIREMIKEWLD
jgi:viroplasmin and RNaseH domain-containing protein